MSKPDERKAPEADAGVASAPKGAAQAEQARDGKNLSGAKTPQCEDSCDASELSGNAEIMLIKSRATNCRMMMGCGLFVFAALLIAAVFAVRAPFDAAGKFAEAGSSGVGQVLREIKDYVNRKPDAVVFGESKYEWSRATNKYVVAEVKERVSRRAEFSKYKILTGNALMEVDAFYQYYIPLRGLKYRAETDGNGKLKLTFYFDSLKPDLPVKYEEVKRDVAQSKFSDDVNKEIESFQKSVFPKILAERAMSQPMLLAAREEAAAALRETLKNTFLPSSAISESDIGEIDIIFGTKKFDSFKSGIFEKSETGDGDEK